MAIVISSRYRKFVFLLAGIFLVSLFLPNHAQAAIAVVQQNNADTGAATNPTISFSSNNTAGNWIGVIAGWYDSAGDVLSSVTDSAGNTYFSRPSYRSLVTEDEKVFYAENIKGGANTITLHYSSNPVAADVQIVEVSDLATSQSFDVDIPGSHSNSPVTSGTYSTAQAQEFAFVLVGNTSACETYTVGTGFTLFNSIACTTASGQAEYQIYSSKQTNTTASMSWTPTTNDNAIRGAVFKAVLPGIQVSNRSDTLPDSRPSATSNHTIAFTINNSLDTTGWGQGSGGDATDTLTIAFQSGFNLSNISCKDVDISFGGTATSIAEYNVNRSTSANCKGSATSWGLFIDTSANTLTFYTPTAVRTYVATGTQVQILIGTNATFQDAATQWITNPSTAGTYTISVGGTFGGSGNILVSINSAATVQVAVAESLAFTVSSVKAVNCSADDGATVSAVGTSPTSVPLGTLFPANSFFIGCQDLVVSTNAGGGYSLTVQEQTLMKTPGGFTIPQTACDAGDCTVANATAWATPTHNGFGHTCFNQDGNHDCASTYSNGTKFRPTANVAAGDAAQTIMASSTPASVTGRIKFRISAGVQQPAGTYTTTIVYTITPTY